MHNWFTCKVTYEKVLENGMQKKVTEPYLVDALSFTEAEARIIEEIRPFVSGEFVVSGINRAHFGEVFLHTEGDKWYKIRISVITLDEKNGIEKRTVMRYLVQAYTFEEACNNFKAAMSGTMMDYVIIEVSETPLMDVYPYEAEGGVK